MEHPFLFDLKGAIARADDGSKKNLKRKGEGIEEQRAKASNN